MHWCFSSKIDKFKNKRTAWIFPADHMAVDLWGLFSTEMIQSGLMSPFKSGTLLGNPWLQPPRAFRVPGTLKYWLLTHFHTKKLNSWPKNRWVYQVSPKTLGGTRCPEVAPGSWRKPKNSCPCLGQGPTDASCSKRSPRTNLSDRWWPLDIYDWTHPTLVISKHFTRALSLLRHRHPQN